MTLHRYCRGFFQPLSSFPSGNWFCSLYYPLAHLGTSYICLPLRTYGIFRCYCITIPLEYLMLKLGRTACLYHQVTSNVHIIANFWFAVIIMNVNAVRYYIYDRKLWHIKWHLDVIFHTIRSFGCTVFHMIWTHIELVRFIVPTFIHSVGRSAIPHSC